MQVPADLLPRLFGAWSPATGSKWRKENPACGQCSVTALVVQDLFGGEILKTPVDDAWHFYNQISGSRFDLTESQFAVPISYDDRQSNRDEAIADTSLECYGVLRRNLGLEG